MSFAHPAWLLDLLLVPLLLLVVQAAARHRARRYAVRFPALASLREAAAATPRWYRLLPEALLLGAVIVALTAAAGPRTTRTMAVGRAAIMLVTDHSGSMQANDVLPSRLAAAQEAATKFINHLPSSIPAGIVSYSTVADTALPPTSDHSQVIQVINNEIAEGSTATGDALALAIQLLQQVPGHLPSAIVLYSDGAANAGQSSVQIAQLAARVHIPIYTVALGTATGNVTVQEPYGEVTVSVPPDPQLMHAIATASHAETFTAQSEGQLDTIYRHLGSHFGTRTTKDPLTSEFGGGAALLLFGAAAVAVRRTPRLP